MHHRTHSKVKPHPPEKHPPEKRPPEKRAHYRVSPPPSLIKELAFWFMPAHDKVILSLEELGMPHHSNINASGTTRIEDISGGGMRFSFPKTDRTLIGALKNRHCYIFLKLRRHSPGKLAPYCLFIGMEILHASVKEDRIHVRNKILTRGIPSQAGKFFQLFSIARANVRELSVWCEEIDRAGRGITPPIEAGIDMEYLLLELSYLQMQESSPAETPMSDATLDAIADPEYNTTPATAPASPSATAQDHVQRLMRATGINPFAAKPT